MRRLFPVQMDLFVTPVCPAEPIGGERQKAVAFLRALLTEAAMTLTGEPSTSGKKEAGNEKDLFRFQSGFNRRLAPLPDNAAGTPRSP